jgi:hypothetical protein
MKDIFNLKIRNFPNSAKVMIFGFLFSLSLAYGYAILNIAMVVGWTPKDIAIHYYGAERVIKTPEKTVSTGEESLNLDSLDQKEPEVDLGPRPSFKMLVQEGHFHLFGMTSFFFALTLLGLFTGISERNKILLCGTPYISIVLDNLSFMATRFLGPHFAYLTALSGTVMGLCFMGLWFVLLREIFMKPENTSPPMKGTV